MPDIVHYMAFCFEWSRLARVEGLKWVFSHRLLFAYLWAGGRRGKVFGVKIVCIKNQHLRSWATRESDRFIAS
jgi:hypothetical protein